MPLLAGIELQVYRAIVSVRRHGRVQIHHALQQVFRAIHEEYGSSIPSNLALRGSPKLRGMLQNGHSGHPLSERALSGRYRTVISDLLAPG
jgi:hypothetical protein